MNLLELCNQITTYNKHTLSINHTLGARLICPEYSPTAQEVKTYPLIKESRIFALCWNFTDNNTLTATMCPSPKSFCYQYHFTPNEKTQLHTHDYIELAYVVRGAFKQKILGNDIIFDEGELCLIDKNCLHQDYLLDSSATVLFLGIANDMFTEIMEENVTPHKITSFLQQALKEQKTLQQYLHFKPLNHSRKKLEHNLTMLLEELIEGSIGYQHICKGLLHRVFRIISIEYEFSLSTEQKKAMRWMIFEEVNEYLNYHYKDVTIKQLSERFHFQEDYFNRLIKQQTGLTYTAYLQQIRLTKAKKLLTISNATIEEIVTQVGYHNKGYFYKIFVEKYGITPSQYRKKRR